MYKRLLCSLTALFMIVMTFAGRNDGIVNAEESGTDDPSYITEGTYRFTTNQGSAYLETDSLQFREDCFMLVISLISASLSILILHKKA